MSCLTQRRNGAKRCRVAKGFFAPLREEIVFEEKLR
jgi:hypothetical protein